MKVMSPYTHSLPQVEIISFLLCDVNHITRQLIQFPLQGVVVHFYAIVTSALTQLHDDLFIAGN